MNRENFERALKKNKIIKYHKLFEAVVKDYLFFEYEDKNNLEDKTCSNCRFLNSCAYRLDYELDTCDEYEK